MSMVTTTRRRRRAPAVRATATRYRTRVVTKYRRARTSRAGRYVGRRRKSKQKIPIGITLGLAGGMIPAAQIATTGNMMGAVDVLIQNYTGYSISDKRFTFDRLKRGWVPLLLGVGVSMIAAKTGVNRKLSLPFVKL